MVVDYKHTASITALGSTLKFYQKPVLIAEGLKDFSGAPVVNLDQGFTSFSWHAWGICLHGCSSIKASMI